jgi:hypothetical protein
MINSNQNRALSVYDDKSKLWLLVKNMGGQISFAITEISPKQKSIEQVQNETVKDVEITSLAANNYELIQIALVRWFLRKNASYDDSLDNLAMLLGQLARDRFLSADHITNKVLDGYNLVREDHEHHENLLAMTYLNIVHLITVSKNGPFKLYDIVSHGLKLFYTRYIKSAL